MELTPYDALIVVDMQNDFLPGGSLAVEHGDEVMPVINTCIQLFEYVIYTHDWHPASHCSFADEPLYRNMSWPQHCVAGTHGAQLHGDLLIAEHGMVVRKGIDPNKEAYSGFEGTDLAQLLHARRTERVFVCGLATDYCVLHTCLDAISNGFETLLIEDATRGVDQTSSARAKHRMRQESVQFVSSDMLRAQSASC